MRNTITTNKISRLFLRTAKTFPLSSAFVIYFLREVDMLAATFFLLTWNQVFFFLAAFGFRDSLDNGLIFVRMGWRLNNLVRVHSGDGF